MTRLELENIIQESLRDWFKKEKWVRISSSGNIAGPCGTSKNKKNPDRCLPKAKAQSLTKSQRAATAQKKKKAGKKGKTVVKNTKKAKVTREHISESLQSAIEKEMRANDSRFETPFPTRELRQILNTKDHNELGDSAKKVLAKLKKKYDLKETKEAPAGHYFTKSGNLVKGRMTKAAKERGARQSDPKDKQRSKVPPVTQYKEGMTKEDLRNLTVGLLQEALGKEVLMEKDDRCTRLAKQKYDTWPSAYASGAVVRCRRGEIWKKK